jgi:hypothetical protein
MVNLLPQPEKRRLLLAYYLRLASTFFFLTATILSLGVGLLIPSYFVARDENESAARYLEALEGTAGIKNKGQSGKIVARFTEQIAILKSYQHKPQTAEILSQVEEHLLKDVTVSAIEFEYGEGEDGVITITGVAKSRTALLGFAESLREESIFKGVSVPVSQLAEDENLKFSLSFGFVMNKP